MIFFEKFISPPASAPFPSIPLPAHTQIGSTLGVDGQVVSGTQSRYLACCRHPDLTPVITNDITFSQQG